MVFFMISWFARFKHQLGELEKSIKQMSRKHDAKIIEKNNKKTSQNLAKIH